MEKIEQAVETYLAKLYRVRSTGGATAETSFYSALEELLNAIGHDSARAELPNFGTNRISG